MFGCAVERVVNLVAAARAWGGESCGGCVAQSGEENKFADAHREIEAVVGVAEAARHPAAAAVESLHVAIGDSIEG